MFGAKDLVVAVLCLFFEYSQLFVMRGGGGREGEAPLSKGGSRRGSNRGGLSACGLRVAGFRV